MEELVRKQAEYLFDEYNKALSAVYELMLNDVTDEKEFSSPEFQDQLRYSVLNSMQSWFQQGLVGLSADTPEAFIDSLVAFEDVMEVFEIAARKVDGDMPDHLMLRVGAFGDESTAALLKMAVSKDWSLEEGASDACVSAWRENILADLAAMRVLGSWQVAAAAQKILDKFCALTYTDDLLADGVKDFVLAYGENVIPALVARLSDPLLADYAGPYEYMLIYLTELGKSYPSDEIYMCLKMVFRKMSHKVIASVCLGDYGDARAIPLLKSYLERNVKTIDRQFFYETLSAIKRLGGEIRDIEDPFRDFADGKRKR